MKHIGLLLALCISLTASSQEVYDVEVQLLNTNIYGDYYCGTVSFGIVAHVTPGSYVTSIFAEPGCHDMSIYSEEGIYNSPSGSALALPFMVNPGQGAPQDVYFDSFLTLYYHHFGGLCNQPFCLSPADDVLDESFHTTGSTCLFPDQFEASPSFQTDDFWLWAPSAALVQNCPTAV